MSELEKGQTDLTYQRGHLLGLSLVCPSFLPLLDLP